MSIYIYANGNTQKIASVTMPAKSMNWINSSIVLTVTIFRHKADSGRKKNSTPACSLSLFVSLSHRHTNALASAHPHPPPPHTHSHTHTRARTHTYTLTHTHTHTQTRAHEHTRTNASAREHTHTYTQIHTHTYTLLIYTHCTHAIQLRAARYNIHRHRERSVQGLVYIHHRWCHDTVKCWGCASGVWRQPESRSL